MIPALRRGAEDRCPLAAPEATDQRGTKERLVATTMTGQDARKEIALLVNSRYPIIYLETWEESRATEILRLVAHDLGLNLYVWTLTQGLSRAGGAPIYNTREPIQALTEILGVEGDAIYLLKDFHKHLEDQVVARKLRDLAFVFRRARRSIVISAPVVTIPVELERDTARFHLGLPDDLELTQLVQTTVSELAANHHIRRDLPEDQRPNLARALRGLTLEEARRVLTQAVLASLSLDAGTLDRLHEGKSQLIKNQGVLEFLRVEGGLDSIGGLARLKAWLARRRDALTPAAVRYGLEPPKGILILGVQGCGKSLCAKAVAREWGMQLLKFDCSALFDKYVGESERNLRKSLQVAEAVAPSVLWIDEIEKMFPLAALRAEADAGLSARIFGSFLTWLQEKKAPVFVVATSNDVSSLPPELLRKGRFDEIFFVDLPDLEARKTIFAIHLRGHQQSPEGLDIDALAQAAQGFSGAEIQQAVTSALYAAFAKKTGLTTEMILKEIRSTFPLSVTMREKVEALRAWARDRTVPAD